MDEITGNYLTVIVANGDFPEHRIPLTYLRNAARIICCDGSAGQLVCAGFLPDAIVGDIDSMVPSLAERFHDRMYRDPDQETNDLTKAVRWCAERGFKDIVILGATGKREDHTLGNISLLLEYIRYVKVKMVTNTGEFLAITHTALISSFPGQQVSIFSIDPLTEITSEGLAYPLVQKKLDNWWVATLNEAVSNTFSLEFVQGRIIVYLKFRD